MAATASSTARKRDDGEQLARYQAARELAFVAFTRTNRVQTLWRALTLATDRLLGQVAASHGVTLLAIGGYGRRELFPYSDVDVLVLVPEKAPESASAQAIGLLQQLWDLQVPVSHATRSVRATIEVAKSDHTIAASLMDARYLAGDRNQYLALKQGLKRDVFGKNPRAFIEAKLNERDARHAKWGDSRFMLEPNVKEGKGGLRDLQTLTWLARYCYGVAKATKLVRTDLVTQDEWRHYRYAYIFFSTVRAHMHILRNRADDRLTFDLQTQLATLLKFRGRTPQGRAEHFMLRYFQFAQQVGALTRTFCALLEEENMRQLHMPFTYQSIARTLPKYLTIENGRLNFSDAASFTDAPYQMVGLFAVAQQHGLDIHPRAHLTLSRALPANGRKLPLEGEANRLFVSILLSPKAPDIMLRRMNEMGVLGAVMPEFGRIVGQMQYDGYHTYTVDEHTLVAVGNLAAIESGEWSKQFPLSTQVAKEISDRASLYLAMLCHDIAKGTGGRHAEKGEEIVKHIAARLGLSDEVGQTASWLVKHHLMLSETAFKRDLDDPKTIVDFVETVQSPERLRLLLLVTVADIKAVGPAIWNGWKGALMRGLYQRAMAYMGVGGRSSEIEADTVPQEVMEALDTLPLQLQEAANALVVQRLPVSWWYRPEQEQLATLRAYDTWRKNPSQPAVEITHDTFRAITEVTCCLASAPELFRILSGVMAWIGASIVSARIVTLTDGTAITAIGIQDVQGNSFVQEGERLSTLPQLIGDALLGKLPFAQELPRRRMISRGREVVIRPAIFIDNQVSAEASVIEVNAKDRLGLLYDILGALAASELAVMSAHIATYGQRAVDVFYVKNAYGHKILHREKIAQVQRTLLAACET